jgi:surface polysaccharide O-acyltransferase-like enzyme
VTATEPAAPTIVATPQQPRVHSIDGLRVLMVLIVFFVHTRDIYQYQYHQIGPAPRISYPPVPATDVLNFIAPLGMALFFGLSGASAWFSLRSRTAHAFARERVLRLLVPLLIGAALLAPWGRYLEDVSNGSFHGPFWEYLPHFFEHISPNWTPRWIGSYFRHLWFLVDLFVFALIGLPIFAYLGRVRHAPFMRALGSTIERPGGLFILTLPVVALRLALGGTFPGYQNWTDTLSWLLFYVYGYLLISDPRRARAMDAQGPLAVLLGLVSVVAALVLVLSGALGDLTQPLTYAWPSLALQAIYALNMCAWLVAAVWLGNRIFASGSRLLDDANRLLLPFYFFHYPVLELTTFYVKPLQVPSYFAFPAIVAIAFPLTLGLAHLLTRRGTAT